MSYETTRDEVSILNAAIKELYEKGDPLTMTARADGVKPELRIHSFDPLSYEEFGSFRNRAPRIVGTLILRSLLIAPAYQSTRVFLGAETEHGGFGITAGAQQLNKLAEQFGREPAFRIA